MRISLGVITGFLTIACGHEPSQQPTPTPAPPSVADAAPPPPPDAQTAWYARVELTPARGATLKIASLRLSQTAGQPTLLTADAPLQGLASGRYRMVVHEGRDCGVDGSEAGAALPPALVITVTRGAPVSPTLGALDLPLDGDRSIIGKTLLLQVERNGAPGRVVGCGSIFRGRPPGTE